MVFGSYHATIPKTLNNSISTINLIKNANSAPRIFYQKHFATKLISISQLVKKSWPAT